MAAPWHSPKLQCRQRKQEKIKATIEIFGCTGSKIQKADFGYEVDDVKCKDGEEYEIQARSELQVDCHDARLTKHTREGWPDRPLGR